MTPEALQAAFQARYDALRFRRERALSEGGREAYGTRMAELVDFGETLGVKINEGPMPARVQEVLKDIDAMLEARED